MVLPSRERDRLDTAAVCNCVYDPNSDSETMDSDSEPDRQQNLNDWSLGHSPAPTYNVIKRNLLISCWRYSASCH